MRRWFHDLVFQNTALKLISLGLGLLLFFVVRSEKQSLAQGTVPLSYSTPAGRVLVDKLPGQLRVGVLGAASRMQRFRFEDLAGVHIDLASVKNNYLKFNPDMIRLPPGLKVVSIRPSGVVVRLEPLSTKSVKVVATVQGQVASGYHVVKRWVKPARVTVRGPSSVVRSLSSVGTQPVNVEGAASTLVQRVGLEPLPPRVSASQQQNLEVSVEVAPITSKVVVRRIPVFFEDSAGRVGQPSPQVVDLTITGPTQVLANLPRDRMVVRPQAKGRSRGVVRLPLAVEGLPKGVKAVAIAPSEVDFTYRPPASPSEP